MDPLPLLPQVDWCGRRLTRLLLGHNPMKGGSHYTPELSQEMRAYHEDIAVKVTAIGRAVACGIDTCQFGGEVMLQALERYAERGGQVQWIATHYGNDQGRLGRGSVQGFEEEVQRILATAIPPIGIQHFGERTDQMYVEGRIDEVGERLKRLRDTGLLVGLCTHLPEVIEYAEERGWDCDFYQTCCYTVYSSVRLGRVSREEEAFEDSDRDRMFALVRQMAKPCLVFKVLAARRKCATPAEVRAALALAYASIKPADVVLVGMWQKHADQIGQNCAWVREILAEQAAEQTPASGR